MGELIQFFLVALFAALGYFVGIAQSWISPEEMKDGRRYFVIMRYVMIMILFGISVYLGAYVSASLVLIMAAIVYFRIKYIDFILAGAILASSPNIGLTGTAIFLYGFPAGSLLYKVRNKYSIMTASIVLMIVSAMITISLF